MRLLGVVLVVAGILAFVYGGFSYLQKSRVVDAGPLQVSWRGNVPIPPIVGAAVVVGVGVILISSAGRRRHA